MRFAGHAGLHAQLERARRRRVSRQEGRSHRDSIETYRKAGTCAREHLAFCELGTPRTVRRYTNNTAGAFGGYAQTQNQTLFHRFLRVRAGLKNLHFASAWQFPGGGFTCAILSGYLQGVHLLEYHLRGSSRRLKSGTPRPMLPAGREAPGLAASTRTSSL